MMKPSLKKIALALFLAAAPLGAPAESNLTSTTTSGSISATASLDFRIIIPKYVFLRVGSAGTGVDVVEWNVPATSVGTGALPPTSGSPVAAEVRSNNGPVNLAVTTLGALSNGAGDSISFTTISATTSNANLAHPTFADGSASAAVAVPATGKIVNETANWTFSYSNAAPVPAGTYGGQDVNNGRVIYTATAP